MSLVGKTYYLSLSLINVESGKIEDVSEDECKCEVDDLIKSSKRLVKRLLAEEVAETKPTPEPETTPKPAETKEPSEQKPVIASETSSPADPPERGKQSQQPPSSPFSKGEYTDALGIETVYVKGGCYQMGCGSWTSDCYDDEKPVHEVCVDDFYLANMKLHKDSGR